MSALLLLTVVCCLTYTFEIVFGLAGTVLLLTALTWLYDAKTLVIYSILPQILVAIIGLTRSPRTVKTAVIVGMLGFAVLGALAGLYLFNRMPLGLFQILLATMITLSGLWLVFSPGKRKLSPATGRALDTLGGASQALFGISGPLTMTRMLAAFPDKTTARNYALAFFLATNLFRGGGYVVNGTFTNEVFEMMLVSGPVIALTLWYSNQLHFHVNEVRFRQVVSWVILLSGVSLFFR
jgi:uncharacterized membrane protein YfcA